MMPSFCCFGIARHEIVQDTAKKFAASKVMIHHPDLDADLR